jgi:uncharacterized protein YkwD
VASPRVARLAAAIAFAFGACAGSAPALGAQSAAQGPAHAGPAHRGSALGRTCAHAGLAPTPHDLRLIRAATLCLVNRERAAHGERPLRANRRLRRAAQAHAHSMAVYDYFEHVGGVEPGGGTPLARMRASGYISSSHVGYEVGENIAWGTLSLATPNAIVAAWMRSPAHRANILDPRYRETGLGVSPRPPASLAHGQPGAIYTQDFGVIIRG